MPLEEIMKTVMEEIRQICQSETVIGKPIQSGDTVIVPVSKVSFGFGGGGGEGGEEKNTGSGTAIGGGANIEPVAFIVVSKGKVNIMPLKSKEVTISKVVDLIPTVMEILKNRSKKDEAPAEEKKTQTAKKKDGASE